MTSSSPVLPSCCECSSVYTRSKKQTYVHLFSSKRGSIDEGVHYLRKAVELGDNNPEALVSLAGVLIEIGNHSEAEEYLNKCLAVNPYFEEAYINYGNLMKARGKYVVRL